MTIRALIFFLCLSVALPAALTPEQKAQNLASFDLVWKTVQDRNPDAKLNGLDWNAVRAETRPLIERAESIEDVRNALRAMLARLGLSHYAIIPKDRYADAPAPAPAEPAKPAEPSKPAEPAASSTEPAAPAPAATDTKMVTFGNLPAMKLEVETRLLPGGAGYIRFTEFLDPVSLMPRIEKALRDFATAPGVILDLRGNRGGIGIMAMGVAGFFVSEPGQKLGEMTMRDSTLKFTVFPRTETYKGRLAILVDSGSASTTEILAQGLQDLGRARIFGTLTAGAALPSDIVLLPNGDRFQFAEAGYTSVKGKVLEGNGVTPDVEVRQTAEATAAGRDLVIEAAQAWIGGR